jgi:hypothetical protein
MKAQCRYKKPDGQRCQANAIAGSRLCFFHDPDRAADRRRAQQTGGLRNKGVLLPAETPDFELRKVRDVVALLGMTINQVRRGQIDPRISNAIGYLSVTLLKALEMGSLEARVSALEAATRSQLQPRSSSDLDRYEFIAETGK